MNRVRSLSVAALLLAPMGFAALPIFAPPPSPLSAAQTQPATPALVHAVASIGITVSDLDKAVEFYTQTLTFKSVAETERFGDEIERLTGVFGVRVRTATLQLGEETIELSQFLAPEGRAIPQDSRSNDLWFQHIAIVVSDMDKAYATLREHKVRHASSGPQTLPAWNTNAAGISAFYFKDPDGHVLEVIHFPQGKGDPRWQTQSDKLFLGIDHTAIVVADTQKSLAFYRDLLGMSVAGGSENSGTEQEHLNNVFGARLRITTLKATSGPGVELLEYLSPTTGRPFPADTSSNDLWHWHTALTSEAPEAAHRLAKHNVRRVSASADVGTLVHGPFMFRDPDGHALVLHSDKPSEARGASSTSNPSR
ncbi:MAG: VOC family protein [Planctomycetota bacterium]